MQGPHQSIVVKIKQGNVSKELIQRFALSKSEMNVALSLLFQILNSFSKNYFFI
jgi:hypothetical protein